MLTDLDALASDLNSSKGFSQQIAAATLKALQELDAEKMNRVKPLAVTVSSSSWKQGDNAGFPFYCDISAQGVTANDFIFTFVDPGNAKIDGRIRASTADGAVRVIAENAPAVDLSVTFWIFQGGQ